MRIGVLALQGDFGAHERALVEAGARTVAPVRTAEQLDAVDALVIPGGESTTMLKLIEMESLAGPLRLFAAAKPVFGTCAGAILMAAEVSDPSQPSFGWLDIGVQRNGYGRQVHSAVVSIECGGHPMEAVFIRAPVIRRAGPAVKVLASYQGTPVLVEQGRHMAATFHPELSSDRSVHKMFLRRLQGS